MDTERSFEFIEFPVEAPLREHVIGHDRFADDRYHGSLTLKLTALTPIFISTGITALGSDVGATVPLLKVMGQDSAGNPILQGTSLKGCIRAVFETITNSTLGVKGARVPKGRAPQNGRRGGTLSSAELVFGAMGLQGLVSIADAVGDRPLEMGYLPPMFQPRAGRGRKFYRHQALSQAAHSSADPQPAEPDKPPSPIQQAPIGTVFTTTLRFSNLTFAQLGAVLIALGQDPKNSFALKVGAGKGQGMGSMGVKVAAHAVIEGNQLLESRYLAYNPEQQYLSKQKKQKKQKLAKAIKAAHAGLIHADQLSSLVRILQYPKVAP